MYALRLSLLLSSGCMLAACSYNPIKYDLISDKMLEKTGAFQEIDRQTIKDEILGFSIHPENKQVLITGKKFQYVVPPSETLSLLMQPQIAQNVQLSPTWNDKPIDWYYAYANYKAEIIDPPQGKARLLLCIKKQTSAADEAMIRTSMKMLKENSCFYATLNFPQYYKTTTATAAVPMTKLSKPYPIVLNIDSIKDPEKLRKQNRNAAILSPFAKVGDVTLTIGQYLALPVTMWF